jgi:hypothetical protein
MALIDSDLLHALDDWESWTPTRRRDMAVELRDALVFAKSELTRTERDRAVLLRVDDDGLRSAFDAALATVSVAGGTEVEAAVRRAVADLQLGVTPAAERLADLLRLVGRQGQCKSCAGSVFWVTTRYGKPCPVDCSGAVHWSTCPHADQWRKRKAANRGNENV